MYFIGKDGLIDHCLVAVGRRRLTNKFMNTTTGRDRANGLAQFVAQFLMWWTARKGYPLETVNSWKNLMAAVATSRRRTLKLYP